MLEYKKVKEDHQEVIGLVPAGGQATRLSPLPCSKELYPIGFWRTNEGGSVRPKVVCHYLLEKMRLAGITKTYMVLRDGKWDIPAYLSDGKMVGMYLAYLMMHLPFGVPYTIDQAYPFVQNNIVAFGFPDIIFQADDAYTQLLKRQVDTKADIVLGLFPVDQPQKWDMVDLNENGTIRQILIKPLQAHLRYTWIIAVWTPVFTQFMHNYLSTLQEVKDQDNTLNEISERQELFLSDVIQAAILNNLRIQGVLFPDSSCLDIGTPDDLVKAIQNIHGEVFKNY
jgi:glucose-1-phosphate thymidylyltransferase